MQPQSLRFLEDIDAVEAAVAALQRINIANTKTNKKVNALENEFNRKIEKLFNKVLGDHKKTFKQIHQLQSDYGNEAKSLIRNAIQQIYQIGSEYVGRVMKEDDIFLSKRNLETISKTSDEVNDFFWRQVQQHIRIYEADVFEKQLGFAITPERALTVATSTALLFSALSYPVLATATLEKYSELIDAQGLALPLGLGLEQGGAKIIWITKEDEKVCPICLPLDRTEYDIGDPLIPIPKDDTHFGCRCRLLLKSGDGQIFSM